jgi:hypothetical protein
MRYFKLIAGVALLAALVGCSNDDKGTGPDDNNTNSTTWDATNNYWVTKIDASSHTAFAYYDFDTRDIMNLTDAQAATSADWDLAFKRVSILTNGGLMGAGSVTGADLVNAGVVDTLEFNSVTAQDATLLATSAWTSTGYKRIVNNWLNPTTRQPSNYIFAMKDAEGKYLKLQIPQVIGGGAPPMMGQIVLKYVYAPTGTDLSAAAEIDTVGPTADTLYYDFSTGTESHNLADPENRLDWDIRFFHYAVDLNSAVFGTGQTSAIQVYEIPGHHDPSDSTDFDAYASAETQPQAYFQDELASTFGNPDHWYGYTETGNIIWSYKHIYAVKVGAKTYKVEIISYYGPGGTGDSGKYTIHWAEL